MGQKKIHSTKVIRVWILGSCICATIFLAVAAAYDFWAMKTVVDYNTNYEKTSYFGLWNKCEDERQGNSASQQVQPMMSKCEKFGNTELAGIKDAPGKSLLVRGEKISAKKELQNRIPSLRRALIRRTRDI
jgi:hypothetical protein